MHSPPLFRRRYLTLARAQGRDNNTTLDFLNYAYCFMKLIKISEIKSTEDDCSKSQKKNSYSDIVKEIPHHMREINQDKRETNTVMKPVEINKESDPTDPHPNIVLNGPTR